MRRWCWWTAVLTVFLVGCSSTSRSGGSVGTEASSTSDVASLAATADEQAECPIEGEEFETAKLYIEHNASDEDTGVHGLFGGEAWSQMCLRAPDGEMVLLVEPRGPLGDLTVSDLFFESREPPNDEYAIADLKADFPEGEYVVAGTDFEGNPRVGIALFTHDIPAPPAVVTPDLGEDAESPARVELITEPLVVTWEAVTQAIDGDAVEIVGYEVIITKEEHDDPNGWSRPVYDVHVGPEVLALQVAPEFLEPATLYELEVLALEVSGNQTIHVGFFETS